MHDQIPASAEGERMQEQERARWLTVAEARGLRDAWTSFSSAVEKAAEKYDADPENQAEAMVFVVLLTLTGDSFMRKCSDSAMRLRDTLGEKPA